jgi:YVTN family beta-propeller protein
MPVRRYRYTRVLRGLVTIGLASLAFAIPSASGSTIVAEIKVGEGSCCVVAQGRSIWVLNVCDASVSEIDPATNNVVRTIPIGLQPRAGDPRCAPLKLSHGGGALWIERRRGLEPLNPARVYRLDTATRRVIRIAIPTLVEGSIAFDGRSLWAGPDTQGTMRRIDARSGRVVARLPVSRRRVVAVTNVVADAKQIWLATGDNGLFRIDPRTKKIVAELRLTGGGEVSMALSGGPLWIAQTGIRRLTRIDTRANRIRARVPLRVKLADRFLFPHLWDGGDGSLWFQPGPASRVKFDPRTGVPLKTITLPLKGPRTVWGIGGVAIGFGSTWIGQWHGRRDGSVFRLTP